MAARRNIFATAFMQAGKFLSAWRGWARDWRRMCYLWEHLDGDGGITIKWNPDGSATVSGSNIQDGGGTVPDCKSIDWNESDELEIKGWESGEPELEHTLAEVLAGKAGSTDGDEMVIVRRTDGTLAYRKIGEVESESESESGGGGGGLSGTVSFVGDVKYDLAYHQLMQRIDTLDLATGQVTQGANHAMITNGQAVPVTGG